MVCDGIRATATHDRQAYQSHSFQRGILLSSIDDWELWQLLMSGLGAQKFKAEMADVREAEAGEKLRAVRLRSEADSAELELSQLQEAAAELQGLEQRYWHDLNDFQRQLQAHVEDRDALLTQVPHGHLLLHVCSSLRVCWAGGASAQLLAALIQRSDMGRGECVCMCGCVPVSAFHVHCHMACPSLNFKATMVVGSEINCNLCAHCTQHAAPSIRGPRAHS